jgi:guanylate kinase
MSAEFSISPEQRQNEIRNVRERVLNKGRLFVLLLGPSAIGKSTIIQEMNHRANDAYEYVKPIITRPNRPGETDKVSVTNSEFDKMENDNAFVTVNRLYGTRYGTPLRGILEPLTRKNNPILDYPLSTVDALSRPEYDTLKFYIYPPSIDVYRKRIQESGRDTEGRLESGLEELGKLEENCLIDRNIDISIINHDGESAATAQCIIDTINRVAF